MCNKYICNASMIFCFRDFDKSLGPSSKSASLAPSLKSESETLVPEKRGGWVSSKAQVKSESLENKNPESSPSRITGVT